MRRRRNTVTRKVSISMAAAVGTPLLVLIHGGTAALAQDAQAVPQTAPVQQPAPQSPVTPIPQPSATTPATPAPKETPKTEPFGVKPSDVKPVTLFQATLPGQPLPTDPPVIRTLDDALGVAFRRSPSILQAQERAVRTEKTVQQILALRKPQIGASAGYTRLSGSGAAFGGGGGGATPSQIQNPFGVGLQITPPGASPVQLSGNSIQGSVGATPPGGAGQQAATATTGSAGAGTTGQSRAASTTRQTTPDDNNNDPDGEPPDNNNDFGSGGTNLNQYSVRASVSQLIDITGLLRTAIRIGDLEKALTRLEIARVRQDTALQVRNGYYNVLRAQAFVRVNEAAVAQSEELVRVTEAQLRAGVAAQFDVLRAQTQLENNRQALISSRNQVSIARNAFAVSLGVDPSTPVDLQEPEVPAPTTLDEQALVNQAFTQRPEYFQADVNLLKAEKNIRLARRNLEPFLNASLSGTYNPSPAIVANQTATGSFGLTLTVPLYDGGATRAQVEAARSDERGAQIQKDQFVRGIKAEVQQAVIAVRDATERAQVTQRTVGQAREALRLANVRFRAGVGTQLDVNDAQTALTQAETNAVNAQYDYLGALARLQRAVGTPQ